MSRYLIFFFFLILLQLRADDVDHSDGVDTSAKILAGPNIGSNKISINEKLFTFEEALPRLKAYLDSTNRETVIYAVRALGVYGDSIAGSEVITKLIKLYNQYPISKFKKYDEYTPNELVAIDIKGEILVTVSVSGDQRRVALLDQVSNEGDDALKKLAAKIKDDIKVYDHLKPNGIPARTPPDKVLPNSNR